MKKKHVMYLDDCKHLLQQVAKNIIPKFIHMKKNYWEKGHVIFFFNNHVGSLYLVCTQNQISFQGLGKGVKGNCRLHYPFFDVTRQKI
jgi:hypothetical protein